MESKTQGDKVIAWFVAGLIGIPLLIVVLMAGDTPSTDAIREISDETGVSMEDVQHAVNQMPN